MTDRLTNRQTDGQTDAQGKTTCLPTLKGGDIKIENLKKEGKMRISIHNTLCLPEGVHKIS